MDARERALSFSSCLNSLPHERDTHSTQLALPFVRTQERCGSTNWTPGGMNICCGMVRKIPHP
jgi:hypothetical protein